MQLVEVVGLPTDLIAFARALQGVPVGSLPGPEVGAPKSRLRVLKVKKLLERNTLSLLQGKRTHEQMKSTGLLDWDVDYKLTGLEPARLHAEWVGGC